jgi:AsmA protein
VGEPLSLDAAMLLEGVDTSLKLEVAEPWAMTAMQTSDLSFEIDLGGNEVSGEFSALAEPLTIKGPMRVALTDMAALTPFIGAESVEAAAPFGTIRISGSAEATAENVSFNSAELQTGLGSATGSIAADLASAIPAITGELAARKIDLRPFFPEEMQEKESEAFPEWSEEEMDFSALTAANADLSLSAQEIVLPTYSLTSVAGRVQLQDGRASTTLDDGRAFGGQAKGSFALNAASGQPRIDAALNFDGIDFAEAGPALLSTKRLFGRGSVGFDLETAGRSQRAWVEALDGTASADIEEGLIDGVDLSELVTTALSLISELQSDTGKVATVATSLQDLTTSVVGEEARTAFDLADFDVRIENGAVSIGEAKLLTDTFRGTVGGGLNLASQGLDMRLLLAAKTPGAESFNELRLPVSVTGSFNAPKIGIDTRPLAEQAARGAAAKALGRAGIEVQEGQRVEDALHVRARSEVGNLLGGLGRRRQEQPAEPAEPASTDDAEEPEEQQPPR